MTAAECVWAAGAALGEGPVWDDEAGCLYWVDILGRAVHRLRGAERATISLPEPVGFVAPRAGGGLLAGLRSGVFAFDPDGGALDRWLDPEPDRAGNRLNDGRCDQEGRLWFGTMNEAQREPTGALYRLDLDRSLHRLDAGYVITNGPAFAPDGRTLYHADSTRRVVYAFDRDPASGAIAGRHEFVRLEPAAGYPDGMTTDLDGCLWLAHFGGARLTRFAPSGAVERVVPLPCANVTSCAFGGPDLATLYVTTAATGLSGSQRREQPLAGGLFALDPGVAGLPGGRFGAPR